MSDDIKQPVEDGIAKLKQQLEADDTEGMKATMTEIEQHLMKFGEKNLRTAAATATGWSAG